MSVDLSSEYLGLKLSSPLVASASPLTGSMDTLRMLAEAGAGAVVLPSVFEEQLEHEELRGSWSEEVGGGLSWETGGAGYFPRMTRYNMGLDRYLELIREARKSLDIPVIASLNGASAGGWTKTAGLIEEAGAHALELNITFVPTDLMVSGSEVEARYLHIVERVRRVTKLPLAIKLGPHFTALANLVRSLSLTGANGVVLFNRLLHPDYDLEELEVMPRLELSSQAELRVPLRWIGILEGRLPISLAATSGVREAEDVIKLLLAGADAVMLASELLRKGPAHLGVVQDALRAWLEEREYESVEQMKGSMSRRHIDRPESFERDNYMKALTSFTWPA